MINILYEENDHFSLFLHSIVQNVQVPQILLLDNPLVCDCHLEWLPSIYDYGVEAPSSHDHLKVMDLGELECQSSHKNKFEEYLTYI